MITTQVVYLLSTDNGLPVYKVLNKLQQRIWTINCWVKKTAVLKSADESKFLLDIINISFNM